MKIKTSELQGTALDWAVMQCEEFVEDVFEPSEYWGDGGPIIEKEKISIEYMAGAGDAGVDVWVATRTFPDKKFDGVAFSEEEGPSPLIAAMRCYVASKMGDEIEIPEELK
jgi:hypothetical protein